MTEQTQKVKEVVEPVEKELGEAAGVCWIDVWETGVDENGQARYWKWSVTHRSAESGMKAFGELHASLTKFLETHPSLSLYPKTEVPTRQEKPSADAQASATGVFGKTPGQPAGSNGQAPQQPAGNKGTGVLHQITIMPAKEGKAPVIEFTVGSFKYPFKDARGPTVVAGLFDAELGITPESLSKPTILTTDSWKDAGFPSLVVDWEKPDKYYNILKVRPGSA